MPRGRPRKKLEKIRFSCHGIGREKTVYGRGYDEHDHSVATRGADRGGPRIGWPRDFGNSRAGFAGS